MELQDAARRTRLLIGIDDTDNLESRGTGFRARELGALLYAGGLGAPVGITRHQLLFDPRIPYTSHNSSLCLLIDASADSFDEIVGRCRDYLIKTSAPGSDAGLCVGEFARIDPAISQFGERAKREILDRGSANTLAARYNLVLEGLTGDHGGIIGALAAVGLRATGHDGRFVWLPGVRELSGVMSAAVLRRATPIDEIRSLSGEAISSGDQIDTSPWPRPVMIAGRAVLLVQKVEHDNGTFDWRIADKEIVKRY